MVARDAARDRYVITEKTISYCRTALAAVEQTGNKDQLGFHHFTLGVCLLWSGHLNEAEELLRAAPTSCASCRADGLSLNSVQCHQGHVILLLPPFAGKAFEVAQQEADKRCPTGMLLKQGFETW